MSGSSVKGAALRCSASRACATEIRAGAPVGAPERWFVARQSLRRRVPLSGSKDYRRQGFFPTAPQVLQPPRLPPALALAATSATRLVRPESPSAFFLSCRSAQL